MLAGTWISNAVSTTLSFFSFQSVLRLFASMSMREPFTWMSSLMLSRRSRVARRVACTMTSLPEVPVTCTSPEKFFSLSVPPWAKGMVRSTVSVSFCPAEAGTASVSVINATAVNRIVLA